MDDNSQNFRIWSIENPYVFEETPLHVVKVGVGLAVSRRQFIDPIFFQLNECGQYTKLDVKSVCRYCNKVFLSSVTFIFLSVVVAFS